MEVGHVGQFEINLCAFESLQNADALVARNHLDEICQFEIRLEIDVQADKALEFLVVFK